MSRENVEIARQVFEALGRRDWDGIEELLDPNIEQHGTVGGIEEGQVARGLDQVRQVWEREDSEIWDEHRLEPEGFFDAGDRVVVFQREYQRGKSSGVELVTATASIIDLRDGRVVRTQGYMDRAAALQAVGLSEQAAPTGP